MQTEAECVTCRGGAAKCFVTSRLGERGKTAPRGRAAAYVVKHRQRQINMRPVSCKTGLRFGVCECLKAGMEPCIDRGRF